MTSLGEELVVKRGGVESESLVVIVEIVSLGQHLHQLELVERRKTSEGVLVEEGSQVDLGEDGVWRVQVDGSLLGLLNHLSIGKFLVLTLQLQFLEVEARNGVEQLLHGLRILLEMV